MPLPTRPKPRAQTARRLLVLPLAAAGLALAGCDAKVNVDVSASGLGSVPQVNLAITGADLLDDGGSEHLLTAASSDPVNLLAYTSGDTRSLIDSAKIASTHYNGLRLTLASSGSSLEAAGGSLSVIDVDSSSGFAALDLSVKDQDHPTLQVVLESRFSLLPSATTAGHYTLEPVIRVVNANNSSSVSGSVDASFVGASACRQSRALGVGIAVYAFSGTGITPRDYAQGVSGGPVASADVIAASDGSSFHYDFPFLASGSYTLAVTCDADRENPGIDDGLSFSGATDVVLGSNEAQTVNLAP